MSENKLTIPDYITNYILSKKIKNEYDPNLFLQILKENNIQVKDYSFLIKDFHSDSQHIPFSKITELIKISCSKLISRIKPQKKKNILVIPIFTSVSKGAGSNLTKSNFWFSLLYLQEIQKINSNLISDVVFINNANENNDYFKKLTESVNVILCDDGIYSGNQMHDIVKMLLIKECLFSKFESIHICVPFIVNNELFIKINFNKSKYKKFQRISREKDIYKFNTLMEKFIFIHLGENDRKFNENKNMWFDHKIPDRLSFKYQPNSEIFTIHKKPYDKKWTYLNKELIQDSDNRIYYASNGNKVLLDVNYLPSKTTDAMECTIADEENVSDFYKYHENNY